MQEIKYQGNYITVTEEVIENHVFERMSLRGGVKVIPIDGQNRILFISEQTLHEDKARWKLVSGWKDKTNRTFLEMAQEELVEEVGYESNDWKHLRASESGSTMNMKLDYFLARNIVKLDNPPENPDLHTVISGEKWFTQQEIFEAVDRGEMWMDSDTMTVLWYLWKQQKAN